MTSIIGYTRVPFNSSASKHFTIAPVKQLYQNKPPNTHHDQPGNIKNNGGYDNNYSSTRRPTYHRMFSREMSQHGIIELIIDKKATQQQKPSDTNRTTNNAQDNETTAVHINNKNNTTKVASHNNSSRRRNNYNIFLSIDLSGSHDYDNLSTMKDDASYDNLQRLMDSISRIVQEKTIHFVNILNLLKKLQLQQEQHRFMSCIDKHNQKILIYFPNTISSTSIDQTYEWLKYTVGIDVNKFRYWDLSFVVEEEPHPFAATTTTTTTTTTTNTTTITEEDEDDTKKDFFDGESYFNDIHMFIDHVDSLIESNGLFSHQKKKRTNYM